MTASNFTFHAYSHHYKPPLGETLKLVNEKGTQCRTSSRLYLFIFYKRNAYSIKKFPVKGYVISRGDYIFTLIKEFFP